MTTATASIANDAVRSSPHPTALIKKMKKPIDNLKGASEDIMRIIPRVCLFAFALFSSPSDSAVIITDGSTVYLSGEIEHGDYEKVEAALKGLIGSTNIIALDLNSPGGDVVEAMKIGDLVNSLRITTLVTSILRPLMPGDAYTGKSCSSACFFILVGGQRRTAVFFNKYNPDINGFDKIMPIGIHRPHFNETYYTSLNSHEAEEKYKALISETKSYLIKIELFPTISQ